MTKFDVKTENLPLTAFTTRPDTLYGVTYLAIAAEHPLAEKAAKANPSIATFIKEHCQIKVAEADQATVEKKGIKTKYKAIHPLTQEEIPVWISNYVLADYGSGAVMAVPAHDERDFEFAKKYDLPIKPVITPKNKKSWDFSQAAFTECGYLIDSYEFNNLTSNQAFKAIAKKLIECEKGEITVQFRLRDWGVSRQRYWGTPIPIIYCDACGTVPVPEQDLPVILPEDIELKDPQSPLKTLASFYKVKCPNCGKNAKRETDTFDTFIESSWYYTRYTCPGQDKAMLDDRTRYWTPVDQYIGGIEHAVMHLLYARFMHKLLRDEGLINSDEPFIRLLTQGMVLKDGAKMSKSKGNTVSPRELIEKYGADTVRLFIIFASPPEQTLEWSDSGVEGAYRFLKRLWNFCYENQNCVCQCNEINNEKPNWEEAGDTIRDTRRNVYEILQQAAFDIERLQLNTIVSGAMKLLNLMQNVTVEAKHHKFCIHECISITLRLLSPIVPHITQQLWKDLKYGDNIMDAPWPKIDAKALRCLSFSMAVQINGKLRSEIVIPIDAEKQDIEKIALNDEKIQKYIAGKPTKKIIVVPKKLVNIVI